MADIGELFNQIMSNPQMMAQVASLAQSLGLQENPQPQQAAFPAPSSAPPPAPSQPPQSAAGQPPQMDAVQLMGSLMQLSKNIGGDDKQLALIHALQPFVRPERARKLERAIQVAKMSRLAEQALHGLTQNSAQAGDFHV